jgi:hypothetical protein
MIAHNVSFPLIHNLEKLCDLCIANDASFATIKTLGAQLTPYAVSLRYDEEFWPTSAEVGLAVDAARDIRAFVVSRMPPGIFPTP